MPIGKYPDFAACVAANQDKDNPEAYCAAIEQNMKAADHKGAIRKIIDAIGTLLTPDAEIVQGLEAIDEGLHKTAAADDTKLVLKRSGKVTLRKDVPIIKLDPDQRLVYGIVYEPDVPDAHNDTMTAREIEKAAHGFMWRYALSLGETGTDHRSQVSRDQMTIVESYIAPAEFRLGTQLVKAGTWVMVAKVHDERLWKDVKARKYTGWSFEGFGRRVAAA
jgi:hypothetical protein